MTIFFFAIKRALRDKFTLAILTLFPILLLLAPPFWGEETTMGFSMFGMVIMFVAFILVRTIMTDRVNGTVKRIFAAPVSTLKYLSQNLLAYLVIIMIQILLILTIGSQIYNWGLELYLMLFVCYTVFAGASIGFSLAWNSVFKSRELSDAIFSIVISMMGILGGVFVPLEMLPDLIRKMGMIFPIYWFSNAISIITYEGEFQSFLLSIGIMLMFIIAFLLYGSKRRIE